MIFQDAVLPRDFSYRSQPAIHIQNRSEQDGICLSHASFSIYMGIGIVFILATVGTAAYLICKRK